MTFSISLTQAPHHSFLNGGAVADARQYFARPTQHTPNGPRIAAALSGITPGEFRTIWANATGEVFRVNNESTGADFDGLDWTPRAAWHAGTEQIIVGERRGSYKLIAYSDVTGDWRELAMDTLLGRFTAGTPHYYGMIDEDDSGNVYLGGTVGDRIFKFNPTTEVYTRLATHLTTNGSNGSMLAWGNGKLYKYGGDAQRWLEYTPGTDTWANPANNLGNGQHALVEYNPTAGVFMLIGGSTTARLTKLVTAAGVATTVTDCPANITMSPDSWIVFHPDGCWLVRSDETDRVYAAWPNATNTDVTWQDIAAAPDAALTYPTVAADYTREVLYIVATTGLYAWAFPNVAPPGGVVLAGIASGEAFGTAQLTGSFTLQLSGIPSAEAFGTHEFVSGEQVDLSGIPSAEAFGTPSVSWHVLVGLTGIASAEAFGAASVSSERGLTLVGIPSAEAFGSIRFSVGVSFVNGNSALDLVLSRVGKWGDTGLRAVALSEMQLTQLEYEQGPSIPWFLLRRDSVSVPAGSDEIDFPLNFMRFDEEHGYAYFTTSAGKRKYLQIVSSQLLFEQMPEDPSEPRAVAALDKLYLFPAPSYDITLTVGAAFVDNVILDTAMTNLWLTHASYVIIAKTAFRLAKSHLQDFELASSLATEVLEAEQRLAHFTVAKRVARTDNARGDW